MSTRRPFHRHRRGSETHVNVNRSFVITLAIAAGFSLAWAQDPSPPDTQTPVRQPQTSPPAATPAPAANQTSTTSPSQPAPAASDTESTSRTQPADEADQEPVPPPRRLAEGDDGATDTLGDGRNCTRLRGIEKAECERRDNPRDDLPAGVTSSQNP